MLLDRAQLRRTDQGRQIFFREGRRNLDLQADLAYHAAERIAVHALDDADAFGGQAALFAEAQYVNPGAGADRGQEDPKGSGG